MSYVINQDDLIVSRSLFSKGKLPSMVAVRNNWEVK